MCLKELRDEFLYDCECRHLAKGSLRNYRASTRFLLEFLERKQITELEDVRPRHLRDLMKEKQDAGNTPRYINDLLKVWRTWFNYLVEEGYLVLGDTNSCLSAISAKRLHIPLFHMEAGNRCKDECLPEETNRRIVDVISDVNMCYSEFARKYLADTGLPKERTYQTGSPMAEVLHMNLEKIQKSDVLERLGLEKDKYILLSAHREENIDSEKNFLSLFTAINALAEKYDMPILYSCHPRSKHRLEKSGFQLDPRVRVNEPLGFNDYNKLQMNALAIVSDSGTLPEESSFYLSIGHPIAAVCIRTSTERPEALEAGDFILAGITTRELLNATDMAIEMKQKGVLGKPCPDYVDETVSMKVVRIIQGYVNVVNKMVWRKY